jgi:hypothetical protein
LRRFIEPLLATWLMHAGESSPFTHVPGQYATRDNRTFD